MDVYCTRRFQEEFSKLTGKKSYRDLPKVLLEFLDGKSIGEVTNGVFLNNNTITPFIKKRLTGSGGYRVYFLSVVVKDTVYLAFIHPKTGSLGSANLKKGAAADLLSEILDAIDTNKLIKLMFDANSKSIVFEDKKN